MSAHVLLNLLNELGKVIKCETCRKNTKYYIFMTKTKHKTSTHSEATPQAQMLVSTEAYM